MIRFLEPPGRALPTSWATGRRGGREVAASDGARGDERFTWKPGHPGPHGPDGGAERARRRAMRRHARFVSLVVAAGAVLVTTVLAGQAPAGGDDLRGTVRSPAGTGGGGVGDSRDRRPGHRLPQDRGHRRCEGRFLVPDLPDASYRVWVRGYGLVDSDAVTAEPGQTLTLDAAPAGSPQEAARVYPANYWYSLLEPPAAGEFPGTGPCRQWHRPRPPEPGRLGRRHQAGLSALSPDGQPVHVRHRATSTGSTRRPRPGPTG